MLRSALLIALTLLVALVGGAASVRYMIESRDGIGAVSVGSWIAYPGIGTPQSDPYSRARVARDGLLVLGRAEGITFLASRDADGRLLDRGCRYRIAGSVPTARVWTLHVAGASAPAGGDGAAPTPSIDGRGVLYRSDGSLAIAVGPHPEPGNWLATTGDGTMALSLTLYDTPVTGDLDLGSTDLPIIERVGCDA